MEQQPERLEPEAQLSASSWTTCKEIYWGTFCFLETVEMGLGWGPWKCGLALKEESGRRTEPAV